MRNVSGGGILSWLKHTLPMGVTLLAIYSTCQIKVPVPYV